MKKNKSIFLLEIGILFISTIMLLSCGSRSEEAKQIAILCENAQNSSPKTIVENSANYLLALVQYQQKIQSKNPKKLDIDMIQHAVDFADKITNEYPNALENILFRANEGTLLLLIASYYSSKGDVVEATMAVAKGIDIFDSLVEFYPQDAVVRGYRAVNYSNLPEIFGKHEIVEKDFFFLFSYLETQNSFDKIESGFFPIALRRAKEFYTQKDNATKILLVDSLLNTKFSQ